MTSVVTEVSGATGDDSSIRRARKRERGCGVVVAKEKYFEAVIRDESQHGFKTNLQQFTGCTRALLRIGVLNWSRWSQ